MKKIITGTVQFFLCILSLALFGQNEPVESTPVNMEYPILKNDATNPCISAAEYAAIEKRCKENIRSQGLTTGAQNSRAITMLDWPLKMAAGFNDCDYYVIYEYVDQDTNPVAFRDYNCGTTTYDGHRGTDIGIAPYPFYKMDNNDVEVIAAAPGIIIDKSDGHFDKNCALNDSIANYVIIQHADGSRALYWHMKKTTITTKAIGQSVVTGEHLGFVGASGSATGPHLHLEVWSDSNSTSLNDAYAGPCNLLNSTSWWAVQKPYTQPAVIHSSVGNALPVLPPCPGTETPNESKLFAPGGGTAYFVSFIRDEIKDSTAGFRIVNLNGNVINSWTFKTDTTYLAAYIYTTTSLPAAVGTYIYEATYNGTSCSDTFEITGALSGLPTVNTGAALNIYPNPSTGKFIVEWENSGGNEGANNAGNETIEIYNVLGEKVFESAISNLPNLQSGLKSELQLNVRSGVYFCQLKDSKQFIASTKLIVE